MPVQSVIILAAVSAAFAAFIVTVGGVAIWSNLKPRAAGAPR
ncbi:MAG: hypothetical protein V7678_08275 [Brevundimonas sp.]